MTANEVIEKINSCIDEPALLRAGNDMRSFLRDCEDEDVIRRVKSVWESKSRKMVNTKRLTSNY